MIFLIYVQNLTTIGPVVTGIVYFDKNDIWNGQINGNRRPMFLYSKSHGTSKKLYTLCESWNLLYYICDSSKPRYYQLSHQSDSNTINPCSRATSMEFLMTVYIFKSSANKLKWQSKRLPISLTYIEHNNGPHIEPWGTPDSTRRLSERPWFNLTCRIRSVK